MAKELCCRCMWPGVRAPWLHPVSQSERHAAVRLNHIGRNLLYGEQMMYCRYCSPPVSSESLESKESTNTGP
ncbi:hypothetical protein U9M48_023107 [Paspalum notatum var. saurae]|uniref:Uncharacterized protein n=1 Tax=Paspalum notatum var. saurae TaxID=547442 RepID=A0AAQ3TKZ8_PASNO